MSEETNERSEQNEQPAPKKTKILICILTLTGDVRCELFGWREELLRYSSDPDHPYTYDVSFVYATKPARMAHNKAAELFLTACDADWLWIWADDMRPLPSTMKVLELLDRTDMAVPCVQIWTSKDNLPVITAARHTSGTNYEMANLPRSMDEPYYVDAAGTGGLLISRKVLEDPRMLVEPGDGVDPPAWFIDEDVPSGRRTHGHDLEFTHRATQCGYTLMVHPQAWCDHRKSLWLYQDILRFTDTIVNKTVAEQRAQWERERPASVLLNETLEDSSCDSQ